MQINREFQFTMENGHNGINIRRNTNFAAWGQKEKMEIEAPLRVQGGNIQCRQIGAFSYFNDNTYIRAVKKIGRFCAFGPNVQIGLPDHSTKALSPHIIFTNTDAAWANKFSDYAEENHALNAIKKFQEKELSKPLIEIGHDVWIGANAIIMRGTKIGNGAIIAAGAVVTNDVLPYEIVGGVPAKHIRFKFPEKIIQELEKLQWWEYGPSILKNIDITDIYNSIPLLKKNINNYPQKYYEGKIIFDGAKNEISITDKQNKNIFTTTYPIEKPLPTKKKKSWFSTANRA